jgi:uncharacterized protein (TIRG00374 family)
LALVARSVRSWALLVYRGLVPNTQPPAASNTDPPERAGDGTRAVARIPVGRIVVFSISTICLLLLLPEIVDVFQAGAQIGKVDFRWIPAIVGAEIASFACIWVLQRIASGGGNWFVVITTHLAGNAFNRITPLGGVTGAALQARMMADADIPTATATSAMATQSILGSVGLGALPLIALPLIAITRTRANGDLRTATCLGAVIFVGLVAVGGLLLSQGAPLQRIGDTIDTVVARVFRRRVSGLGSHLIEERAQIRAILRARWITVAATSVGRWVFEYLALLSILIAIGAGPDPLLILYALIVASLITLIPLTPGGLGLVELGLAGSLVAAGVSAPEALLATFAFRLVSFWLPLPIGAGAAYAFRSRYPRGANVDIDLAHPVTTLAIEPSKVRATAVTFLQPIPPE